MTCGITRVLVGVLTPLLLGAAFSPAANGQAPRSTVGVAPTRGGAVALRLTVRL